VPSDDADDLAWLLFCQCDVISRAQALETMSAKALQHRLDRGRWRAVARGVYLTHTGPLTREQASWVAVLAVGDGAMLGGLSALASQGLRGHRSDVVHVLVPARRRDGDPPPWVVVHRTTKLAAEDIHPVGQPPCTLLPRSVVDAAAWAGTDDQARVIVAASFQQRKVGLAEVCAVLDRMPRSKRRAVVRSAALDASGGAHSLAEIDFVRLCRREGLPTPSKQVRRSDAAGRPRYLDVYFEEYGVHVEIDGGQHIDPGHWWADMRRQNALWISGDRVLRFPAWVVRTRPGEVLAQVRAALVEAGWRP
jgi:very-short-patch-repair endonuclease